MTTPWHPIVSAAEHAEVEELQRQIATIDAKLEWLAPHVAEAEELTAERGALVKREGALVKRERALLAQLDKAPTEA